MRSIWQQIKKITENQIIAAENTRGYTTGSFKITYNEKNIFKTSRVKNIIMYRKHTFLNPYTNVFAGA